MQIVKVMFKNPKYNYVTECNGNEDSIRRYFVGQVFNLATEGDNLQRCIDIELV